MDVVEGDYRKGVVAEDQFRNRAVRLSLKILQSRGIRFVGQLGEGTFGSVVWVQDQKQRDLAAKIMCVNDVTEGESQHWQYLKNKNILPLISSTYLSEAKTFIFFMPKCHACLDAWLENRIFRCQQDAFSSTVSLLKDVLCGLQYLHSQDLCHLDIKCSNVLVSFSGAMLADFGFVTNAKAPTDRYGSPHLYRPPEARITADGCRAPVDGKSYDMWTVGILALEMLTGQSLVKTAPSAAWTQLDWLVEVHPTIRSCLEKKTFLTHMKEAFPWSIPRDAPLALRFIKCCLDPNPATRPTVHQALGDKIFGGKPMKPSKDDIWSFKMHPMRLKLLLLSYFWKGRIEDVPANGKPAADANKSQPAVQSVPRKGKVLRWFRGKETTVRKWFARVWMKQSSGK